MKQEPTVWDFVKSRIFFWRGEPIAIPEAEQQSPDFWESATPDIKPRPADLPEPPPPTQKTAPAQPLISPWVLTRLLLPLLLAWVAQLTLEPPNRSAGLAAFLYALAAGWMLWAAQKGEWQLAARAVSYRMGWDDMSFRWKGLAAAGALGLAAFIAFGGNRFNFFNTALWLSALAAFLWGVWQRPVTTIPQWKARIRTHWQDFCSRGLRLSPWTLLVLAAFALIVFFRFYQLDQVPKEMISDHAEKLLDVANVLDGRYSIFFPRNTGREAFQMYLTAAMALIFNTGLSFMSLKLGTALAGVFTMPFIYLTGKEVANRRVGLLAMIFAGIAYWPNVITRLALRFTLYPFFYAPMVYFLMRGFRRRSRNDFILAGLFLGLGLHGYSPYRFVPFVVLAAFGLYLLHQQSQGARLQAVGWLALTSLTSLIVFIPLGRYWMSNPEIFSYRAMTRMTGLEQPLPGPAWQIFLKNTWNALLMFFWDNGEIWVHSVIHRPALDVISAALFFSGVILILYRYIRKRDWMDIFWLLSIPLLMMPSILSLAFPAENPSLNRTGAAIVPVFLLAGWSLDGWMTGLNSALTRRWGRAITYGAAIFLLFLSIQQNYDLVFQKYRNQFDTNSWNNSELGAVIRQFADTVGSDDQAWIIPYPYWVDTRLVSINAGDLRREYHLWVDELEESRTAPAPKLFLFKPEDEDALNRLQEIYPNGVLRLYDSAHEGREFYIYFVPEEQMLEFVPDPETDPEPVPAP